MPFSAAVTLRFWCVFGPFGAAVPLRLAVLEGPCLVRSWRAKVPPSSRGRRHPGASPLNYIISIYYIIDVLYYIYIDIYTYMYLYT